jgi:hypothetical protein
VHFLFPHIRVELLIRTILTRQWDDDAWLLVRQEFVKALALRSRLRKGAGGTRRTGHTRDRAVGPREGAFICELESV